MGTNLLNPFEIFAAGADNILLTNLLSYYNFDEASGNLLDIQSTHDFTLTDAPTQGVTGKINDAYDFNGTSNFCTSIDGLPWDIVTSDYSISIWFKRSSIGSNQFAFDYRSGGNVGFGVLLSSANNMFIIHNSVDLVAGDISDTDFHHFVFAADRDVSGIGYLDNVNIGNIDVSSDLNIAAGRKPIFGTRSFSSPASRMNGLIDEFGIWDRALTSDEVALLYNSGNGLSHDNFG